MRYNTNNPVGAEGSNSPLDLNDNSEILDLLMTGSLTNYLDRLGVPLTSWRGIMKQVADYLLAQGYEASNLVYGAGVIVLRQTQLIERAGELYRVALAANLPLTLSGNWATDAPKLQSVGDLALRTALSQPDGAQTLVGGALFKGEALDPNGTAPDTTVSRGYSHAYYPAKAGALRVGGSDTAPLNDERGYWSGLPSQNAWGNQSNIGLYSQSFGRNGAAYREYSATFGHDCVTYGVASIAGGAGCATGSPSIPTSPFAGYCSITWGKNNLVSGEKTAAFGEEHIINTRAAVGCGYAVTSQPSVATPAPIGAFGAGQNVSLFGQAYGIGRFINPSDSMVFGWGPNAGSPLKEVAANEIAIGAGTTTGAIRVAQASTSTVRSRVGLNNRRALEHELDIDISDGAIAALTIDAFSSNVAAFSLRGLNAGGTSHAIANFEWTNPNSGSPLGILRIRMNNRSTVAIAIASDGSISFPDIKNATTVAGSPSKTIYEDGGFVKILP
ncbi:hypothetical protein CCOS865_02239 [Pseudomonas reidholzensis]|uniref:Uncharacterized protein n=1 Tax=Pseudomonas reidholzensis TaxID=1785162 RepID=A0A383RT48_9PSED|nr:hypothetical protein [Pseudomonas reidholzensis]SYX89973.1 hypothetical protein CCOS865_02239 [Pseudomonas reidholzensis]